MIIHFLCRIASNTRLFCPHFCQNYFCQIRSLNKMSRSSVIIEAVVPKPYQNGIMELHNVNGKWAGENEGNSLRPVAICGPSGSGKSTLLKRLMSEYKDCIDFSISHTTRKPRPKEIHGKDYYFVSRQEMEKAIANGEFIEHTEFSGNMYGTSKKAVHNIQEKGNLCILDIEIDGVKSIKKTDLNAKFIFIKPPSLEVLEQRLRSRGTETEDSLQKRLSRAKVELEFGEIDGNFDVVITNKDLQEAYEQLKNYLHSDMEKVRKQCES